MKLLTRVTTSATFILLSTAAIAQEMPEAGTDAAHLVAEVVQRYSTDSFKSNEEAEAAIKDVKAVRGQIEQRYTEAQHMCYDKFFTTACLDKATEQRRADLSAVRPIELEANSYIRHARVAERDSRLEQAERERAAKAAEREGKASSADVESEEKGSGISDAQRAAHAEAQAERVAEHEERERERQAAVAAEADKRARNVQRYEEKVRKSEERQREIARHKTKREQDE